MIDRKGEIFQAVPLEASYARHECRAEIRIDAYFDEALLAISALDGESSQTN